MGVVQDGTCFAFVIVGVAVFFNVFMAIMLFLSTKQQKKRQLQKLFFKNKYNYFLIKQIALLLLPTWKRKRNTK
jgi:hypothetical protein